jgi:hypothetical protein
MLNWHVRFTLALPEPLDTETSLYRSAIFSVAHDTTTQNKVIAALARGLSISL